MGKTGRDFTQIYAIYGVGDWQTPLFLLIHAILFAFLSMFFLLYFEPLCYFTQHFVPFLGPTSARFAAGFTGTVTAISAVCLFFAAGNIFYSSVSLQWEMGQRMVNGVTDWSTVKHALDLGCGRGMLLNAVALHLKKSGSSGRVVGLTPARTPGRNGSKITPDTLSTLRTACLEGVQEYVTCRAGDPRTLPFSDNYFDVVVSGVFLHTVGKEFGPKTAAALAERMRVLGEVVRVLKPGGVGVVWDLVHVPEFVKRLHELRMEEIMLSERVTAFMASSHIVSFRKPSHHSVGANEYVTTRSDDLEDGWPKVGLSMAFPLSSIISFKVSINTPTQPFLSTHFHTTRTQLSNNLTPLFAKRDFFMEETKQPDNVEQFVMNLENRKKRTDRIVSLLFLFLQITCPLPLANWNSWSISSAEAVLYSPETKIPRTGELALRRAIPANTNMKSIQDSLEELSYLLRIPQRKPYGTMEGNVKKALKIATDEKSAILSSVPAELREKGSVLHTSLVDGKGGLQDLLQSIKDKNPDKVSVALASTLDTVAQLELLQAPGLSFLLPEQYATYPR
ncbi:hypothetical protein LIER_37635 [Lithospermum erythrorhizon]|uniref:Methyltransferase type 11 domain-containing protein n=1 Tax=Lithospermum erythrorhizon TaxID=34254 RepID=A0AAV3PNC1_LITER